MNKLIAVVIVFGLVFSATARAGSGKAASAAASAAKP